MEADDIQCKFPRISNGSNGRMAGDEEDDDGVSRTRPTANGSVRGVDFGGIGRFYGWPSSRIVRVSRASGGKDRHSKVLTCKGLRDRRVRLSVNTAIQFYDLQDRLGYDQPSKAVEWLLKAAASSIAELPPMSSPFPDTPQQMSDEKRSSTGGSDQVGFDSTEVNMDAGDPNYCLPAAKSSACSSNSETSKGSGLSLSRSESRIKARERAKDRVAERDKEKEKGSESPQIGSANPSSQTTSFTELLSGGIHSSSHQNLNSATADSNFVLRSPMDYFNCGLAGPPPRPGQMPNPFGYAAGPEQHQELLQFSFLPDHLVPAGGEYNLNFSISSSSGLSGFNRGTLQSNSSLSSSLLPHFQRFPDGSPPNFFIGAATPPVDNNHQQFLSGYDANAHIGSSHSGQKGKGKN